jgi:putative redox protein
MIVSYKGGTLFEASERGHEITVDLPADKGGTDRGMMPPELLLASLGTCIGIYVTGYCKQVGIDCDGLTVELSQERLENPLRIGAMHATVHIPGGIPEDRRHAMQKVAESCMVHQTLCNQPELTIQLD